MNEPWPRSPFRRCLSRAGSSWRLGILAGFVVLLLTAGCLDASLPDGDRTGTPDCRTDVPEKDASEPRDEDMPTPEWESENEPPEHEAARWTRLVGGSEWDAANAVVRGHDGGYVFTGRRGGSFLVVHVDASGQPVWEQRGLPSTSGGTGATEGRCASSSTRTRPHSSRVRDEEQGASGGLRAVGRDVVRTPDGGYVVAADRYLVKLDSGGDVVWAHPVGARASAVVRTSDGDYVVAGATHGGDYDGWMARVTPTGETKWERSYGGAKDDLFTSLARAEDGAFVAAGHTKSAEPNQAPWVVKVDATGDGRWSRLVGTARKRGWAEDVVRTRDGGFALTGYRVGPTADGVGLWKLAPDGTTRWGRTYGRGKGAAIVRDEDGGYAIAGTETAEARLLVTDGTGELQGDLTYGREGHAYGVGLAPNADGDYVLVGRYKDSFPFDALAVEFRRPT